MFVRNKLILAVTWCFLLSYQSFLFLQMSSLYVSKDIVCDIIIVTVLHDKNLRKSMSKSASPKFLKSIWISTWNINENIRKNPNFTVNFWNPQLYPDLYLEDFSNQRYHGTTLRSTPLCPMESTKVSKRKVLKNKKIFLTTNTIRIRRNRLTERR